MAKLTEQQRQEIMGYLQTGQDIPDDYRHVLFPPERREYELVYVGKEREEDIIANTWGVPLQAVKTFNLPKKAPRPEWTNRLIFGDNLQVMKRLLDDPDVKGKVKLVYIDPPFATRQDFQGSQDQKAYQDKVAGAEFLEFLRKRLVLIRELLSANGSVYIHLDWKKVHSVKVLADEVFGENNFVREIIWRLGWVSGFKSIAQNWIRNHETLLFYSAHAQGMVFNKKYLPYPPGYERWGGRPKGKGLPIEDVWGVFAKEGVTSLQVVSFAKQDTGYPTQKPEGLVARIIEASSNPGDIVVDAFAGSGTTCAVAEKLDRRWIGIDCGKLAVYTMQKRLMNLRKGVGKKGRAFMARPFTLYNGGLYDFKRMRELPWDDYRLFALQLFQVRDRKHTLAGIELDGFKNDADVLVFNFNGHEEIVVDEEYVAELHRHIGGRTRSVFYIIAPASRVTFLEDYIDQGETRYYILRIPYSIIDELHDRPFEQIRQPVDEMDINNTVEAVGFDFIIPPTVKVRYGVEKAKGEMFDAATITIQKFASEAMTKKARKFANRETLSMVMVDYDYAGNGEGIFDLDAVFYRDDIEKDEWKVRLDATQFGRRIMIIYMDIFGNELREVKTPSDFGIKGSRVREDAAAYRKAKRATNKPKIAKSKKKTAGKTAVSKTAPSSKRRTAKKTAQRRSNG